MSERLRRLQDSVDASVVLGNLNNNLGWVTITRLDSRVGKKE